MISSIKDFVAASYVPVVFDRFGGAKAEFCVISAHICRKAARGMQTAARPETAVSASLQAAALHTCYGFPHRLAELRLIPRLHNAGVFDRHRRGT